MDPFEDLDLSLFMVESLARNQNLTDLGLHYRLLQFQKENDPLYRQEALKRMSHLVWLHPAVQISFLNYTRDSDPRVRVLAVNVLRNINNLQVKTLAQIKTLYETENIKELEKFVIL